MEVSRQDLSCIIPVVRLIIAPVKRPKLGLEPLSGAIEDSWMKIIAKSRGLTLREPARAGMVDRIFPQEG